MKNKTHHLLGGTLLVAGTSIGGGMLALPILTSIGGFLPSIVIYLLCWLFMATTGLLFLEICFWVEKDSNIISMAKKTLGIWGEIFAWVLYIFLFYSLTLAYVVGCGDLIIDPFEGQIPDWIGPILFILIVSPLLYLGPKVVSPINIYLVIGLIICFITLVILGSSYVKLENLERMNWTSSLIALPIAFTAFAYQGIIPTLANYMKFDIKSLRKAILIGSFIPFFSYIIWQWLILGVVSVDGSWGLREAFLKDKNAIWSLNHFIPHKGLNYIGRALAFFALITSFFGVTLGLRDFLSDGLGIKKTPFGKGVICLIILIPPLVITYLYPRLFLRGLDLAGGFGCALLLGLLPVLMVWSGRYHLKLPSRYQVSGGRPILILLIFFIIFEVGCEIAALMGKFPN